MSEYKGIEDSQQVTINKRNSKWSRDELIVALDLYFLIKEGTGTVRNDLIAETSELLNNLPSSKQESSGSFRNFNGVSMKLGNFAALDPGYRGSALSHGSKHDRLIWDEFASNRKELSKLARLIRNHHTVVPDDIQEEDQESFVEGSVAYKIHRTIERSSSLVKRKKSSTPRPVCEICGFDFEKRYGLTGSGYIECHHLRPISEYDADARTTLNDLALVCANCHRMLHRKRPWITRGQLAQLIVSIKD